MKTLLRFKGSGFPVQRLKDENLFEVQRFSVPSSRLKDDKLFEVQRFRVPGSRLKMTSFLNREP